MMYELTTSNLECEAQVGIKVFYRSVRVGEYFADIIVFNRVIIEIKAAESISPAHVTQLINYLKATDIEVGLLLNFGPKAEFRRKIFTAEYKKH